MVKYCPIVVLYYRDGHFIPHINRVQFWLWGRADEELKVPFAKNTELSISFIFLSETELTAAVPEKRSKTHKSFLIRQKKTEWKFSRESVQYKNKQIA